LITYDHPRPWHRGSTFTPGPRRVLSIGERCLWLARLEHAFATSQLTASQYLVGRALLQLLGEDGRLDPGHAYLGEIARCSRRTVQRALERLQEIGLVRWTRRLVRAGWRAEQASNAYELVPDSQPQTPKAPPASTRGRRLACERQPDAQPPVCLIPIEDAIAARAALADRARALEERERAARAVRVAQLPLLYGRPQHGQASS
jgi:hypothetical protein